MGTDPMGKDMRGIDHKRPKVTFGGEGREDFSSIVKTSDGYVLAGSKKGKGGWLGLWKVNQLVQSSPRLDLKYSCRWQL